MHGLRRMIIPVLCLVLAPLVQAAPRSLDFWFVDSLVKVFPSDKPAAGALKRTEAWGARNQHLSLQLAVRSSVALSQLSAECEPLLGPKGASIKEVQVRPVGYVVVGSNSTDTPAEELVGEAPGWYPDPLLDFPVDLKANRTQPVWAIVHIPIDASPGLYQGALVIRAGQTELGRAAIRLNVVDASVPRDRNLKVTNWFNFDARHLRQFYKVQEFSPEYWTVIENIARVMGDHRQNVILTPVMSLVRPSVQGSGLRYDFSNFDRWVETFQKQGGFKYIEGSHLLGRAGYNEPLQVGVFQLEGGKALSVELPVDDPRVEPFLTSFLPALNRHLEEKGWKSIYLQHVLDEPHGSEPPYYARFAALVHRYLPGVPTIDAIDADNVAPEVAQNSDIWVPLLGRFDTKLNMIQDRIRSNHEVWFYTCLFPRGKYMNRLMDYPLIKTRLLHWLNFRYNLTGFLHWGGNYWTPEPMKDTQPVINLNEELLPSGDAFIVYPDAGRKSLYSSIRLEAMREGIEDYELLRGLGKRYSPAADEIVKEAVTSLTEYVRNPAAFRKIERKLLETLSK